jgi:hypothetical protein
MTCLPYADVSGEVFYPGSGSLNAFCEFNHLFPYIFLNFRQHDFFISVQVSLFLAYSIDEAKSKDTIAPLVSLYSYFSSTG